MVNNIDSSLILLTYKGKVLLMLRNNKQTVLKDNKWSFIGGTKEKNKSSEQSIFNEVEKQMSIKLTSVEFLSSSLYKEAKKYYYYAKLTDDNVNNIKRDEGQTLYFFTLLELEKLPLTTSTRSFVSKYKGLLKTVPND